MKVLHLNNNCGAPYHYVDMLRRKGIDAHLMFAEGNIVSHPLWSIADTDLEEVQEEGEARKYPISWVEENRDRLPEWVHAIPYDRSLGGNQEQRYGTPGFFIDIVRRVRAFDCDIIHAWTMMGAIWASFSGKPYIYWVTGWKDFKNWERSDGLLKPRIHKFLAKRAVKNAEMVVGSKALFGFKEKFQETIENYSIPVKSLRHPIDTQFFKPNDLNPLKEQQEDGMLLFSGARNNFERKRNHYVFEALSQFGEDCDTDFHLLAADWGKDTGKAKDLVSELGLENQVTFTPFRSRPRLIRTINASDAVLDQFRYSFGTLATQTLSCGTPLISALNIDEFINSFEHPPVLVAESPEDIAGHLKDLTDDRYKNQVSQESRNWIKENYWWEDGIQDYIDIYESIIKGQT